MRKKKLLFHSNFHNAFTGFGKNCRNVLSYLYKTGKYEIVEYATGLKENPTEAFSSPWKVRGSIPNDPKIRSLFNGDPKKQRDMGYGGALIDQVITEEKPDVYIGAEDIWAFSGYWHKPWWNKITCAIWTTIDSLPILPDALEAAPKIQNYFVWSPFAEKAFKEAGHNHIKTLRGSITTEDFLPLPLQEKSLLRKKNNISPNDFIIGFVFRNQLRKSVPNMLDGFKIFTDNHPEINAKLILHTNWSEGWEIPRLIKEKNINPSLILTTYLCSDCGDYEVKPFAGQDIKCSSCGSKKGLKTTGVHKGVTESQLNEVYNIMDVYCHPFTSGGQEIPIQEAKLTELVTLATNYSCGIDMVTPESGGIPLDWSEYREPGTQFIKATTSARSIYSNLVKFYNLPAGEKKRMGETAREFVINNFSQKVIGNQVEEFIDQSPFCDYNFSIEFTPRNPHYNPPSISDDSDWLCDIYKNILKMDVSKGDEGLSNWLSALNAGRKREDILKFFKDTANKENSSYRSHDQKDPLHSIIDDDLEKRLIIVLPKSIGDVYLATSLLPSIKKTYPNYAIYFATEPSNFPVLQGNPYLYKAIPYESRFDNLLFLEGAGDQKGFFDIAFLLHLGTQKMFNYQHNGEDKIQFDICT